MGNYSTQNVFIYISGSYICIIGSFVLADSVKNSQDNHKKGVLKYAFEAVPMYRRTVSLPDTIQNGDIAAGLGMAGLALINLPEDCRDVVGAAKQVKSIFTGKPYEGSYKYKDYQHNFSFFRGTAVDELIHKKAGEGKGWANWLLNNDKPLAETELGKKIISATGAIELEPVKTQIKDFKKNNVVAAGYKGHFAGEMTGRAMRRVTKLGLIATAALELPKIIKTMDEGNDLDAGKQFAKSAINIATVTAGVAYGGAIGSKYGKGLGSLVGMGTGAILGSFASNAVQSVVS